MLPSYLLALREGTEAALVIGIVLGALRKIGRGDLSSWAWAGTAGAGIASLLVAVALNVSGAELEGNAELMFEGAAMILAAALLTWMIFWMRSQSRLLKQNIESGIKRAVGKPHEGMAVLLLAGLAVLREGVELALFLLAARLASNPVQTFLGAVLGLVSAIILGGFLFASTRRLNLHLFFQVTNVLLILFAAGLVAHGVHEFNELGWIPPVIAHVWDLNPILNDQAGVGLVLKALLGYNGNPSLTEALAYGAYFVALWLGLRIADNVQNSPTHQPSQG